MEDYARKLKAPTQGLTRTTTMASLVFEMLNSSTTIHLTHLQITGPGSFAAHNALGDFYAGIKGFADNIAEQYQGVTETLLRYPETAEIPKYTTVPEALDCLRELYSKVESIQRSCPYSEIQNTLDEVKSLINSTKYKLLFLS